MRLKRDKYPEGREVWRGTITPADIRRKFNLHESAVITLTVPGGADWSGMTVELGVEVDHLSVKVEKIR
jgi:hypothetical protein